MHGDSGVSYVSKWPWLQAKLLDFGLWQCQPLGKGLLGIGWVGGGTGQASGFNRKVLLKVKQ